MMKGEITINPDGTFNVMFENGSYGFELTQAGLNSFIHEEADWLEKQYQLQEV